MSRSSLVPYKVQGSISKNRRLKLACLHSYILLPTLFTFTSFQGELNSWILTSNTLILNNPFADFSYRIRRIRRKFRGRYLSSPSERPQAHPFTLPKASSARNGQKIRRVLRINEPKKNRAPIQHRPSANRSNKKHHQNGGNGAKWSTHGTLDLRPRRLSRN